MKSDEQADKILREKLNSYSSPVPAGLFDAMDKKRNEQKKTVLGWYAKAGGVAVALLLVFGLCYWNTSSDAINTPIKSEASVAGKMEESKVVIASQNDTQKSTINTSKLPENKAIDSSEKAVSEKVIIATSSKIKNTTSLSNDATSGQNKLQNSTNSSSSSTENTKTVIIPNESSINVTENATTIQDVVVNQNVAKVAEVDEVKIVEEKLSEEIIADYKITNFLENKYFASDDNYHAAMPRIKCGWEARKVYLYFDALTSIDMAFRELTPKDIDSSPYAILRNNTEGMQESFSLGFRASAVTRAGLAMRTGLIFSSIKEPFSQRITSEELTIIETRNGEGDIISIDTVTNLVVEQFQTTNRHKLLDVPLILGYEIDKDKYNISVNGGAYLNITATQEGSILTPDEEIVSILTGSPNRHDAFKTNVGLSLYGSFAINYKITPSIHFIFEPYGRYFMNSFTTDAHELDQNYFIAGMQVGMRLKM